MKYKTVALIMAAGTGDRFASNLPKQYFCINDKPILTIASEKFLNHPEIDAVMVVINNEHKKFYEEATKNFSLIEPAVGGLRRQDSVRLGLVALKNFSPENILIHDAARIFVTSQQISLSIEALKTYDAVTLGSRVVDSLRYNDETGTTANRDNLFAVQTPQSFKYNLILKWHEELKDQSFTDDVSLAQHGGCTRIKIIESSIENFKITTQEDLELAKKLI